MLRGSRIIGILLPRAIRDERNQERATPKTFLAPPWLTGNNFLLLVLFGRKCYDPASAQPRTLWKNGIVQGSKPSGREFASPRPWWVRWPQGMWRRVRAWADARSPLPPWEVVPWAWQQLTQGLCPQCPRPLVLLALQVVRAYGAKPLIRKWRWWLEPGHSFPEPKPTPRQCPWEGETTKAERALAAQLTQQARKTWQLLWGPNPQQWPEALKRMNHLRRKLAQARRRLEGKTRTPCWLEALAWFLLAARWEVLRHFELQGPMVPQELEPEDPRAIWVLQALQNFSTHTGKKCLRILDAGCGWGRYARWLAPRLGQCRWVGVDRLDLKQAQQGFPGSLVQGDLLALPLAAQSFDVVLCMEALEHTLVWGLALKELVRVVRPGGMILLVDKHHRLRPRCQCPDWEQWFDPQQVAAWFRSLGAEVRHGPIPFADQRRLVYWWWKVQLPQEAGSAEVLLSSAGMSAAENSSRS